MSQAFHIFPKAGLIILGFFSKSHPPEGEGQALSQVNRCAHRGAAPVHIAFAVSALLLLLPGKLLAAPAATPIATALPDDLPDAPTPVPVNLQTTSSSQSSPTDTTKPQAAQPQTPQTEDQVRRQEKQRVMGIVPNFNVSYSSDVPPLTRKQKFQLAFRSSIDPFQFVAAALDAAYSQATDDFGPEFDSGKNSLGQKIVVREEGYGQGWVGYSKRLGASYADNFDGTILGNALLPILLKEDPRYFRRGTGTVKRRMLYAISTTVWCKRDNGTWGPNYSNVIGNLAAGGISNIYYPSSDRGAGLTITRGLTVTAEGTLGGLANEFLPDLTRHFLHREVSGQKVNVTAGSTPTPAPTSPPPAPQP